MAGLFRPGFVALRDTPVTPQAGLRAREWMSVHPDGESPSHVIGLQTQWRMTHFSHLPLRGQRRNCLAL
jgi:hypothetical protein